MSHTITDLRFQAFQPWGRRSSPFFRSPGESLASSFGQIRQSTYHPAVRSPSARVNSPSPTTSEPVLPRVATGETGAMNQCIDRYGALVWGIARRFIRDTTEAEDLVQEVFTEVWKKAASFNPALASESTFIGMITRRRAIDFLRRNGRMPGFESLDAAESLPHPEPESSSASCDSEAVKSSLDTLPTETRQLFRLFFDDGFTHPEIAEKTGLPLGTVKTRLRRGLLTLRDQLKRAGIANTQTAS